MENLMHPNKNLAIINDQRIFEAATYSKTKGLLVSANPSEIYQCFVEFKMRVKNGGMTVDQLEEQVYGNLGILEGKKEATELSNLIKNIVEYEKQYQKGYMEKKSVKRNSQTSTTSDSNH